MPVWVIIDGPSFYSLKCFGLGDKLYGLPMADVCPHLLPSFQQQPHWTSLCCPNFLSRLLLQGLSRSCPLQLEAPAPNHGDASCRSPRPRGFSFRLPLGSSIFLSSMALIVVGLVLFCLLLFGSLILNYLSHLNAGSNHVSFALESQMPSRF